MKEKVVLHIRDYNDGPEQDKTPVCRLYRYLSEKLKQKNPPYVFTEEEFLELLNDNYFFELRHHINFYGTKNYPCGNKIEMRPEFKFILQLKKVF